MGNTVEDPDSAIEAARSYADDECVGELGEVTDVDREDGIWIVEFQTHTFSEAYEHRIRIAPVGNVFGHERMNHIL